MNIKNFIFEQDPFAKIAQCFSKIYHEVLLLMKFLQTKPQVKKMNIKYYDLYYTVNKNRREKNLLRMLNMKMIILILMISFLINISEGIKIM